MRNESDSSLVLHFIKGDQAWLMRSVDDGGFNDDPITSGLLTCHVNDFLQWAEQRYLMDCFGWFGVGWGCVARMNAFQNSDY